MSCLSAGSACPSGSLSQFASSGAVVECRVGATVCQLLPYTIPVQDAPPSETLVGCLANNATACPAAYPVAFSEQPAWTILSCRNRTSCPVFLEQVSTRFTTSGINSANKLVACLTTDFSPTGTIKVGACPPASTTFNLTVASLSNYAPGTPSQRTTACLALGAACPSGSPLRYYGISTSAPSQVYCQPVPTSGVCPSAALGSEYPVNVAFPIAITGSSVLLGCIINSITACPADFPVPSYSGAGAIVGCAPNGTAITCPAGTVPLKSSAGVVQGCVANPGSGGECTNAQYPISVRTATGNILECLATGSQCPAAQPLPLYAAGFDNVPASAPPVLRQCWPASTSCTQTGQTVEIRSSDVGAIIGCVDNDAVLCPVDFALAYRAASTALAQCRPLSQAACPTTGTYSPYSVPGYENNVITSCLTAGQTSCPGLLYPVPVASSETGVSFTACSTASRCPSGSIFLASTTAIQRCLTGATSCTGLTVYGGATATDASNSVVLGCLQSGAQTCLPGYFPFYENTGSWALVQCRTGLPAGGCPSGFPIPGLDESLATRACVENVNGGSNQGCPSIGLYQVGIAATQALSMTVVEACYTNEARACPSAAVLTQPRSFSLYNGNAAADAAGNAFGQLVGCIATSTSACASPVTYGVEVFSDVAGLTLVGCAGASTSCPANAPFPLLSTSSALDNCRPAITACPSTHPVALRKAAGVLNGCMAGPTTQACPNAGTLTTGTTYSWPLMGATSSTNPAALLKECRSVSSTPANCNAFTGYPTIVNDGLLGGSGGSAPALIGCLEASTRCPGAGSDVIVGAYQRFVFSISSDGNTITGCYQTAPALGNNCPTNGIEVTDGTVNLGCIAAASGAANIAIQYSACGRITTATGYPLSGTSTTYKFSISGSSAAAAVLATCTTGTLTCTTGMGRMDIVSPATTGVGCIAYTTTPCTGPLQGSFAIPGGFTPPYPGLACAIV